MFGMLISPSCDDATVDDGSAALGVNDGLVLLSSLDLDGLNDVEDCVHDEVSEKEREVCC